MHPSVSAKTKGPTASWLLAAGSIFASQIFGSVSLVQLFLAEPACADENNMNKGIGQFQAANYNDALTSFQMALSTDFNSPKLHYYLGSTFVHLNRKDAGIREYRIAYALDPDKEVGKLSKKALELLGADSETPKTIDKEVATEKKAPVDPILEKVNAALQAQAENQRNINRSTEDSLKADAERRNQEQLARAKQDMQRDSSYYRRGRVIQLPLPPDALRQLDTLKQMYDTQKNAQLDQNARRSDELQKSADNLSGLLGEKSKAGSPKLVPEGTSLYVRNYKNEQAKAALDKATADKTTTDKKAVPRPSGD